MLSLAHAPVGALIAVKIGNPFIALPIIFASHFLMDWIPHWDVGAGMSKGIRKKDDAIKMEIVELFLTFALVFAWWQVGNPQIAWLAWFGAFIGILPDLIKSPKLFFNFTPAWLKPFNEFHDSFHCSTQNKLIGLTPQVITLLVVWLVS